MGGPHENFRTPRQLVQNVHLDIMKRLIEKSIEGVICADRRKKIAEKKRETGSEKKSH